MKTSTLLLTLSPVLIGVLLLGLFVSVYLYNFLAKEFSGNMEEHGQPFDTSSTKEIFRSMGIILLFSFVLRAAINPVKITKLKEIFK
jgi:hypothetical protein